jgi:hypothetical protein
MAGQLLLASGHKDYPKLQDRPVGRDAAAFQSEIMLKYHGCKKVF